MSKNDIKNTGKTEYSKQYTHIDKDAHSNQIISEIHILQAEQDIQANQYPQDLKIDDTIPDLQVEQPLETEQNLSDLQSIQSNRTNVSCAKNIQFAYSPNSNAALLQQVHKHLEDNYIKGEFCDEIRSYYVPASSVRKEYNTLCQYKKDNIFELIDILCTDLLSIITLIEYLSEKKNTSVEDLSKICTGIASPLQNLREICAQRKNSKLIHKTIA